MESYYDVLGVEVDADLEEVRRAYYGRAQVLHPDRYATAPDAERRQAEAAMKVVNEAWSTLRHPDARRRYDSELGLLDRDDEGERPEEETDPSPLTEPHRPSSAFRRAGLRSAIILVVVTSIVASVVAAVFHSEDQPGGWSASATAELRFAALNAGMTAPQAECFVDVVTSRYGPSDRVAPLVIQQVADACR